MSPYWWVAVVMLALYGLVAAALDVVERLFSRGPQTGGPPLVSVLVIVKDREDSIEMFLRSAAGIGVSGSSVPYEIVAVDDYSSDNTWRVVQRLAASCPAIKAVRMADVPVPGERAETIGLFMCAGDIALVCRFQDGVDEVALLSVVRHMLRKPGHDRSTSLRVR
ncbi:MAG: glycosyltransferase family 2 protein [Firmicutes bacterium]|nr:glycosyltransferase family 2 protein [Bacillota bacterium]